MGRRTFLGLILTGLLAGTSAAGDAGPPRSNVPSTRLSAPVSHDYLTVVGPPPLRFQSAAGSAPRKMALPPLEIPEKESASPPPEPSVPRKPDPEPEAKTERDQSGTNKPTPQESAQAEEPDEPDVEPEVQSGLGMTGTEPPIDPKMLLKYFQKNRESGSVTGVTAPMGFMPPKNSSSSRATYSSNP